MELKHNPELFVALSDEASEKLSGGGFFGKLLKDVVNWIGGDSNDGSTSGALKSTGKAVVAWPVVGALAVATAAENDVRTSIEFVRGMAGM